MAFVKNNVVYGRGKTNTAATPNGMALHTYYSDTDVSSTIFAGGYFDDYLGATADDVIVGDILWVRDSSGDYETYKIATVAPLTISSLEVSETFQNLTISGSIDFLSTAQGMKLPTFGGTQSTLSYYEVGSFNLFWNGAFTIPEPGTVKFVRIGNIVSLEFPGIAAAMNSVDTVQTVAAELPSKLRPASNQLCACVDLIDNATPKTGVVRIQTDGNLRISLLDSGTFAGAGNLDWKNFPVTYIL